MSARSNRSPKKTKLISSDDLECAPIADADVNGDGEDFGDRETVLMESPEDHPFSVQHSEGTIEEEDVKSRSRTQDESKNGGAATSLNELDRQYSETPSWIQWKKWQKQMEVSEVAHLSLHQLARDGDDDRIRLVLDNAANLNAMRRKVNLQDEDGNTPLHYASRYSFFKVIKLLLERGADANCAGEDDMKPLHFLARCKRDLQKRRKPAAYSRTRTRSLDELEGTFRKMSAILSPNRTTAALIGTNNHYHKGFRSSIKVNRGKRKSVLENGKSGEDNGVQSEDDSEDEDEDEDIVSFLVNHGADINAKDLYGMTALHHCAMRDNFDMAEDLLGQENIDIDARDYQNMTPLHVGCSHGSTKICNALLKAGAALRSCDDQYNTPLHFAAQEGHMEIITLLIGVGERERGGRDTIMLMMKDQDYERNTPLFLAVNNGNLTISKFLLEQGADANTHSVMYDTALHAACIAGDVEIVELLIQHGASIDSRNVEQDTPLHKACAYNRWRVVEYLIDKGANIEATDHDGFTPLLITAKEGHPETLQCLLLHDVKIDTADKTERTAFSLAAEYNNLKTLQVLLENDKIKDRKEEMVNKGDRYMNTPVHKAARKGYLEITKLLLEHGCKMDTKNEEEQTPLHLAAVEGRTRIVRVLLYAAQTVSLPLYADEDEDSNTPLHIAAIQGHEMVCKVLIEAGANIAARNAVMWTPLDCAAANGWEKTTTTLLDYEAPIDPIDKTRTTPLHLASKEGHNGVVELLLKRGAKIELTDHKGRNCLDHAIDNNHKNVALTIINHPNWKLALNNCQWEAAGYRTTPLRKLIRSLPDVAEVVFSKFTTSNGLQPDDRNYAITFDYTYLDDTYITYKAFHQNNFDKESFMNGEANGLLPTPEQLSAAHGGDESLFNQFYNENGKLKNTAKTYTSNAETIKLSHPLMLMVRWQRQQLLSHPLVRSLLRHKWNRHGRYVYYSFLILYSILVGLLTTYVLLTPPTYHFYPKKTETMTFTEACQLEETKGLRQDSYAQVCKYAILLLTVFHIVKELFQAFQRRMNYLSWDNVIEWAVYLSSFIFVFDFTNCTRITGIRTPWQWQLGAVCIFLAWMGLVLYIQKLPRFGIYVVMFMDILRTFASFFLVFLLFIIAFALAFFVLFQNQPSFQTLRGSLVKTAVMMIGEFEYDGIFNEEGRLVYYQTTSYALFCVFVIIMTILIMNLLVGLAVDDIKAVQDQALLKRLAMQVQLVLQVEQMAPERFRKGWIIGHQTLLPNKKKWYLWRLKQYMLGGGTVLSKKTISSQLNREKDDMDSLRATTDDTVLRVNELRREVHNLNRQQERLNSMLNAIVSHFEIPWEDEDQYKVTTKRQGLS